MRALILIDLQNDFVPGGALAVKDGDQVIAVANALARQKGKLFDLVMATQDWHPANHGSFASNNTGARVGEMGTLAGLPQIMWPDHCVQGSPGAEFVAGLDQSLFDKVIRKGTDPAIDSYSGLFDNGHRKATGLGEFLQSHKIDEVVLAGLATDYCVKFTALDARGLGLKTIFVRDGSRAVNLQPDDEAKAISEMEKAGVIITTSEKLLASGPR